MTMRQNNTEMIANPKARSIRGLLGISKGQNAKICTLIGDAHDILNKKHIKVKPEQLINEIAGQLDTPSEIMYAGIVAGRHLEALNIY